MISFCVYFEFEFFPLHVVGVGKGDGEDCMGIWRFEPFPYGVIHTPFTS